MYADMVNRKVGREPASEQGPARVQVIDLPKRGSDLPAISAPGLVRPSPETTESGEGIPANRKSAEVHCTPKCELPLCPPGAPRVTGWAPT